LEFSDESTAMSTFLRSMIPPPCVERYLPASAGHIPEGLFKVT
jgi:hypothetical protein